MIMDRTNKYKTLLSNTCLISIGTFGSKLMAFLMVRFYTGILSPSDYGTADLIIQTANLLAPLVSMGIVESVFRFALNDPLGRKKVFSAGIFTISAGALLLIMALPALSALPDMGNLVWLIAIYTTFSCYHSLCAQFVRAQGKTALFAGQGVLNTALVISLNILFLAVFQWGITGYVLAIALADILCSLYLICKEQLWEQMTLHPGKRTFSRMLRYSIPLIPATVFWWITSVSDRYMITAFLGSNANGLYAVACKIPTLLTLVSGVFLQAWVFSAVLEAGRSRREQAAFYSQVWGAFMAVMFLACSMVIACSRWELKLLSAPEYYQAWRYIPVLSGAMVFSSFVTFMGSVYVVKKKTILSLWTAMAGAMINLLLNGVLIPNGLGVQGGAIATFVSYLTVFLLRAKSVGKLMPFRLYKGRVLLNCMILCLQSLFVWKAFPSWKEVQAVCMLLLLAVNGKALWAVIRNLYLLRR